MDPHLRRVAENILPLSAAGTLSGAFKERHFTGETVDHEMPNETCQLCDKEGLRYHFQIRNDHTGHRLDVGSECILKFQVAVFEQGLELSPEEARKALTGRMRQMRLESCLRALERLTAAEAVEVVANCDHLARLRFSAALPDAFTEHGALMASESFIISNH